MSVACAQPARRGVKPRRRGLSPQVDPRRSCSRRQHQSLVWCTLVLQPERAQTAATMSRRCRYAGRTLNGSFCAGVLLVLQVGMLMGLACANAATGRGGCHTCCRISARLAANLETLSKSLALGTPVVVTSSCRRDACSATDGNWHEWVVQRAWWELSEGLQRAGQPLLRTNRLLQCTGWLRGAARPGCCHAGTGLPPA